MPDTIQLSLSDIRAPFPTGGRSYRLLAFADGQRIVGKGKGRRLEQTSYGYQVWTADTTAEPWREGYGSFCFAGLVRVRAAAMRHLWEHPEVRQLQVRTNQDRTLYIWNRQADGRITGYWAGEEGFGR